MTRAGRNGGHQKGLYSWLESTSTVLPEGTAGQSRTCIKREAQPTRNQLRRPKRGKSQPEGLQTGLAGDLTGPRCCRTLQQLHASAMLMQVAGRTAAECSWTPPLVDS